MYNSTLVPKPLQHTDEVDRRVGKAFLEERGWYDIQEGGEHELDLIVPKFKRGADVECFKGNLALFEEHGYFRIPVRKQKYWSGEATYLDNFNNQRVNKYQDWFVDYIQFCNSDTIELLWYPYKLVKHYHTNTIVWEGLHKKNYQGNRAVFIKIPYDEGIKYIQHWKYINNEWVQVN